VIPFLAEAGEGAWPGIFVAGLFLFVMPWVRRGTWHQLPVIAFTLVLTVRYLAWRLTESLPSPDQFSDWVVGIVFVAVETLALISTLFTLIVLTRSTDRSAEVAQRLPALTAKGSPPLVDVFICTFNEGQAILERTIVGALAINYPNFRVTVLDDGRRDWLKQLCGSHGCNYLTRPDNSHAKAGNINNALRHVAGLPHVPEFVLILDADFVPASQILWRTVSLMQDESTGLVQTPQHFVNPDPIQTNLMASASWPDEQRFFFDVIMPARDAWGTSFCCGTSALIRFSALQATGGFPTDSVTEDYLLSLRLSVIGQRTTYLNERLSMGLAPEGLGPYLTQRGRWCLGFIQIFMSADGPFNFTSRLSLAHRLALCETSLYWAASHSFRMLGLIIPILYLLFDLRAVDVGLAEGLSYFLPAFIAQMVTISWLSGRRVLPVMTDVTQLIAAPAILKACAKGILQPRGRKFKVTAKGGKRSSVLVKWELLSVFASLLVLTLIGVAMTFVVDADRSLQSSSSVALFWSWYNVIILTLACFACVEQPTLRKHERLSTRARLDVICGGATARYQAADCSVGGVRFEGNAPGPLGTKVVLHLDYEQVNARIVRLTDDGFAVEIEKTTTDYAAMVRYVYAGQHSANIDRVKPILVAKHVLARVFG